MNFRTYVFDYPWNAYLPLSPLNKPLPLNNQEHPWTIEQLKSRKANVVVFILIDDIEIKYKRFQTETLRAHLICKIFKDRCYTLCQNCLTHITFLMIFGKYVSTGVFWGLVHMSLLGNQDSISYFILCWQISFDFDCHIN